MDDGSLCGNSVMIHCNSFSEDLCKKFKLFFKFKFNIGVSIKQNRSYFYLKFDLKNSVKFLELIQDYVHPVFNYKLINKNIKFNDWSLDCVDQIQYSEVVSTKLLRVVNKPQYLYDIEVEDNHNYFVYTKNINGPTANKRQHNTLLVHNCISSWGTSFRPMYKEIGRVRQIFKTVPIVALTATADPLTKEDIVRVLKFNSDAKVYTHPVDRSNISYKVIAKADEYSQTYNIVNKYSKDTCGIIYCMTRAKAEKMEKYLKSKGVTCEFFHAGMKVADKKQVQDDYMNKELNLIIATVAFGMGIDRSDVRYVINVDIPNSLEEFSQMSGRASRDGLAAESYILYSYVDVNKAQWLLRQSIKSPERLLINANKLKKMVNFCETFQCRRKKLLEYFGESPPKNCGNCDNCL
jgi:superfamily II DNA or RNA helicase